MRYLLFSFFVVTGCASEYKALQPIEPTANCIVKIRPTQLETAWYNASIDVVGKHISGLMLIKNMPDSSVRVVFTNEAGIKFLDFEFGAKDNFNVHYIMKQLNKKPVIHTLRKDFELMLFKPFQYLPEGAFFFEDKVYYAFPQKSETAYFITSKDCASLQYVELGSKRKKKVTAFFYGSKSSQPDSISLVHHTFDMHIKLRKLKKENVD
jgi:hypothetical protein